MTCSRVNSRIHLVTSIPQLLCILFALVIDNVTARQHNVCWWQTCVANEAIYGRHHTCTQLAQYEVHKMFDATSGLWRRKGLWKEETGGRGAGVRGIMTMIAIGKA